MQRFAFFLAFVLQTGLHATPAQLLFNLIIQTRQARQRQAGRQAGRQAVCSSGQEKHCLQQICNAQHERSECLSKIADIVRNEKGNETARRSKLSLWHSWLAELLQVLLISCAVY
jgi:hypothetical protein